MIGIAVVIAIAAAVAIVVVVASSSLEGFRILSETTVAPIGTVGHGIAARVHGPSSPGPRVGSVVDVDAIVVDDDDIVVAAAAAVADAGFSVAAAR